MKNYGEELAYWYFRLNGFFPITDFVTHKVLENKPNSTSDIDILAVRFPYCTEEIAGRPIKCDDILGELEIEKKIIGVICEVKTGKVYSDIFKDEKIYYAVKRLGFIDIDKYKSEIEELKSNSVVNFGKNKKIVKILIAKKNYSSEKSKHIFIEMSKVVSFIKERFEDYSKTKTQDRLFFPSTLIQYIIDDINKFNIL